MRRPQSVLIFTLICVMAHSALAETLPHRKDGLWETSMSVAQRAASGIKAQQCIDGKTDEAMQHRAMEGDPSLKCERATVKKTSGGFDTSSVCKTSRGKLTSQMHITGDMQSAYRMEISSHRDPPQGTLTDTKTVVDAKWLGACPADMKPGDMRVNGLILHMGGMAGEAGAAPVLDPEAMKSMTPAQRMEYLRKNFAPGVAPQK